ncbi:hypothetical protein BO71DRAFT_240501 [Aspergillus ellipticus CBS 707.79]|uniref:Uncharacterized protein n=1 Tax=Aspergillus ellipticus CBS 707.79 TaxID=1448320 RepID=A0A319D9N0_9EURO|nr:hypothetical protein BO71DRAFT_240501 [Aspergillus ellipticus CBS 707.79]
MTLVTPRPTLDRLGNGGRGMRREKKCCNFCLLQSIVVLPLSISIQVISATLWFGYALPFCLRNRSVGYENRRYCLFFISIIRPFFPQPNDSGMYLDKNGCLYFDGVESELSCAPLDVCWVLFFGLPDRN